MSENLGQIVVKVKLLRQLLLPQGFEIFKKIVKFMGIFSAIFEFVANLLRTKISLKARGNRRK